MSPRRRPLRRPDIRVEGPRPEGYLLQAKSERGKVWLEARAEGRHWVGGALLIDHAISTNDSLVAQARAAGLGLTGCGPVCGDMLWTLRDQAGLTVAQIAKLMGFTAQEWRLMEADERMVPDPDAFWDRAMRLLDDL
jgi:hypothetical protein